MLLGYLPTIHRTCAGQHTDNSCVHVYIYIYIYYTVGEWWLTCGTGPYSITACGSDRQNGSYNSCNSCTSYFTCTNGTTSPMSCSGGLFFDTLGGNCVPPNSTRTCYDVATNSGYKFSTVPIPGIVLDTSSLQLMCFRLWQVMLVISAMQYQYHII